MKISAIEPTVSNRLLQKNDYTHKNNSLLSKNDNDIFIKNHSQSPKSHLSFGLSPHIISWELLGISPSSNLDGSTAIDIYSKFALGNYLDIGDDKFFYDRSKRIRDNNLEFLDLVTSTREKEKFVEYFKSLTGFPNLKETSSRITSQFVRAAINAQSKLNSQDNTNAYNVLQMGYDGVCSVGRGKAFPGSDLDKAYVILRGDSSSYNNEKYVDKFKGELWKNTDQRILSYNHDEAAFPQVYTINQLVSKLTKLEKELNENGIKEGFFSETFGPFNYTTLKNEMETYKEDYVKANRFLITVCKMFPYQRDKVAIKNLAYLLEAIREGVYFSNINPTSIATDYPAIRNSMLYKYSNPSQLKALKLRGDKKPKRLARENIAQDFASWAPDKKYRFIKTLIQASCANNKHFTDEFSQYFSQSRNSAFDSLEQALLG